MIAPTHLVFGITTEMITSASGISVYLYVLGNLLPDIDAPQSFLGRISYPFSKHLYERFGHRKFVHSALLWLPLLILGKVYFEPLYYLALGCFSHIFLDLFNKQGVQLLAPISNKTFVIFQYANRVKTASKAEYIIIFFLMIFGCAAYEMNEQGGFRMTLSRLIGSYQLAYDRYMDSGDKICYINGLVRSVNGETFHTRSKVVGVEGKYLVVYDQENNKLVRVPIEWKFIYCYIEKTKRSWNNLKLEDVYITMQSGIAFNYDQKKKKWKIVESGSDVTGFVNYEDSKMIFSNSSSDYSSIFD